MPTSTIGPQTGFIPSHEATNNLVVDFIRNPDTFALSEWSQYIDIEKTEGRYVEMTIEMAARILNTDNADSLWPDGATAPTGHGNLEYFEWKSVLARRHADAFEIGEIAAEQASWDVLAQAARQALQRAMSRVVQSAVTLATTAGTYDASHTSAVSSISGVTGKWDVSTTARKDIKRSLDHAANQIETDTLGSVTPEDLMVVMSPGCARKIATSQEIVDHVKQSPSAEKELTKTLSRANRYGLPEMLYGYPVVIENTKKTSSRKGGTVSKANILADATPFMTSRVGGLDGIDGSPSFSSFSVFWKEQATVESKHDRENRRHNGRVVNNYATIATAPVSAFLFTAATA